MTDNSTQRPEEKQFMYSHLVDGIISGMFRKLAPLEVKDIIMKNHFSFTPLTPLTEKEERLLLMLVTKDLCYCLNRQHLEDLCGQVFYDGETFYINGGEKSNRYIAEDGPWLLTPDQKMKLFFDPKIWHKKRVATPNGSDDLTRYGNRNLLNPDGYFGDESEFRELLKKIRRNTGTAQIIVLDMGCGMGKALQDMKEIDPHIETHGITMEPEPAMFSADQFHYMVAERMPLEFEGRFHLIVSNMAFRYFLFQHKALLNVVKALASGGCADLHFSYDSIENTSDSRAYFLEQVPDASSNHNAMKILVKKTMAELKILQEKGKIKITPSSNFYQQDMQGGLTIEKFSN